MQTQKKIAIVGLSALGIYLASKLVKVKDVQKLAFAIHSVNLSFEGLTPILTLTIDISNPTTSSYDVQSLIGFVSFNGKQIASVQSFGLPTIAPTGITTYNIPFKLQLSDIVTQLVNLFKGISSLSALINFNGSVVVDNLNFPVDLNYKIV